MVITGTIPPAETVRGRIHDYIKRNQHLLTSPVIEIGSRLPDESATWANNRIEGREWIGVDMQTGCNVDHVMDAGALSFGDEFFGACLCSEVLEHVMSPLCVLKEAHRVLVKGGAIIITTLMTFPVHGYPDDYWRFTPSGLRLLLVSAGFENVEVESAGRVDIQLDDHGEEISELNMPLHVFGKGFKL